MRLDSCLCLVIPWIRPSAVSGEFAPGNLEFSNRLIMVAVYHNKLVSMQLGRREKGGGRVQCLLVHEARGCDTCPVARNRRKW